MGQSFSKTVMSISPKRKVIQSTITEKVEIQDVVNYKKPKLDPLELDCIVEIIFSYLDIESLKAARQVNKFWSIEGAKLLLSKGFISIPKVKLESGISYLDDGKILLEEFKTFLSYKSKERVMISKIKIEEIDDIKAWNSVPDFGKRVDELQLNIIEKYPESLKEILPHLPNLKLLDIPNMDDFDYCDTDLLEKKIRKIMNTLVSTMSQAHGNRHPLMITSLNLDPNSRKYLKEVEKFADCQKVLVENFCFAIGNELSELRGIQSRALSILHKILLTSRESMKRLVLYDCEILVSHLQIPVMPTLTTLELNFYAPGTWGSVESVYKFHPSVQLRDTFPKLTEINLYWDAAEPLNFHFWTEIFQNMKPVPSVKRMTYSDGFEDYCLDKVLMTFPNLEHFDAWNVGNFENMIESIWKHGKNMKTLKFDLHFEKIHGHVSNFDSLFTGFSSETVESIKNSSLKPKSSTDIEKLRVNPSIWDLEDLECVTIRFRGDCKGRVPSKILSIAGKYAFKYLDVEIYINIRECTPSPESIKSAFDKVSKIPEVRILS